MDININIKLTAEGELIPFLEELAKKYSLTDKIEITPKVTPALKEEIATEEPQAVKAQEETIEQDGTVVRDFEYLAARAKSFIAHRKAFTVTDLLDGGRHRDHNSSTRLYQFLRSLNLHKVTEKEKQPNAYRRQTIYVPTWKDKSGNLKSAKVPSGAV